MYREALHLPALRLLTALIFYLLATPTLASGPTPYRELRYQNVVGQTDWFTCGPAAVATLLRYYFGRTEVDEARVLALALEALQKTEGEVRQGGISALALRQAMRALGVESRGFRLSLEQLRDYFVRGGLPLILHTTLPEPHYVVAVGLVQEQVLLADPSWGQRMVSLEGLVSEKGFGGVVLVPLPDEEAALLVRERQAQALGWAQARLRSLRGLSGRWP